MDDLVIIGGGAAGFTAALYAKRFNRNAKVTIITNEGDFYSRCALPFVISGEIESFEKITHDIEEMCQAFGIRCIIDDAIKIDSRKKLVKTSRGNGFPYKSLIIATGSNAFIPPIQGVEKEGVFTLKTLEDAKKILNYAKKVKKAVVIGGGPIGVEISAALKNLGLEVTLVELLPSILRTCFSPDFSEVIHENLNEKNIRVITGNSVEKILGGEREVTGVLVAGKEISCEMVVVGVGVRPNVKLAQDIGIEIEKGAIKVNEKMETSHEGIFAIGDCVCTKFLITEKPILSQLGTTAIRQGTIAGINALGGNEKFKGVLNSVVLKIFDMKVGVTGLNEVEAKNEGFQIVTGKIKTLTKEDYISGAKDLFVKLIFNQANEKILGCEIIGGGEGVAEKVDLIAFAIQNNSTIDDILKLDYCYTPPIISSHNALVLAAENAKRKLGRIKGERREYK
jgi:NADH oxidase (H2O2-forming)